MLFKRQLSTELIAMAKSYPIVTITGPRQSGKTTLSKICFPDKPYVNLEAPDIRAFAQKDPKGFLGQYQNGAIIPVHDIWIVDQPTAWDWSGVHIMFLKVFFFRHHLDHFYHETAGE